MEIITQGLGDWDTMNDLSNDDMLDEYAFRGGVRGKYADRYAEGAARAEQIITVPSEVPREGPISEGDAP
jgi:hypothetical protein